MNIEMLLNEVSGISKKYGLINQKTGGYFNVFEITNIATAEVAICRILYDLLNPKGSHYQGHTYLKLFLETVLPEIKLGENEYENVEVYREYRIRNNRRIDLFIQTPQHAIPIEVKIYARDQKSQCSDYYQYAVKSNVYYLTRFGDDPTKESTSDLATINVTNLSFAEHILNWLNKCLENKETMKIAAIREILFQLISIIRKFTGKLEDEQEMEVQKIIAASSEHMKSAVMIEQSVKASKRDMMNRVFKEIQNRIDKTKVESNSDFEYADGKNVMQYYEKQKVTYPSINYLYKKDVRPGIDIWFGVEIDWRIYAGFYMVKNDEPTQNNLTEKEIKQVLSSIEEPNVEGKWLHWEYLPIDDVSHSPNFKSPDLEDDYYRLFDEGHFNQFIEDCIFRINKLSRF